MVFNKIKEFVAPVDEDEDEGEELQFTGREVQPVSTYESKQTNLNNISKNTQMVMFEPRSFEQAEEIARHLKQTRGCIINLHRLQREYAHVCHSFRRSAPFRIPARALSATPLSKAPSSLSAVSLSFFLCDK